MNRPQFTILMPCLNEEKTLGICLGKAKMANTLLVKTVPAGTTKALLSKMNGKKLNLIKSYKVQVKAFKGSGESKQ